MINYSKVIDLDLMNNIETRDREDLEHFDHLLIKRSNKIYESCMYPKDGTILTDTTLIYNVFNNLRKMSRCNIVGTSFEYVFKHPITQSIFAYRITYEKGDVLIVTSSKSDYIKETGLDVALNRSDERLMAVSNTRISVPSLYNRDKFQGIIDVLAQGFRGLIRDYNECTTRELLKCYEETTGKLFPRVDIIDTLIMHL